MPGAPKPIVSLLSPILRCTRVIRASFRLAVGRAYLRLGRYADARQSFREVLQHRGDDVRAYIYLGRIALLDGDLPQARRELAAARRANPETFELWMPRILGDQASADSVTDAGSAPCASPFTQPGARQDAGSWFWYLDASGQSSMASGTGPSPSLDGWSDTAGDEACDASEVEAEFWSSIRSDLNDEAEAESAEEADAWWRSGEPESTEGALFAEDAEEEQPSWLSDPLAAFYDELTNTKDSEAHESFGDFSSIAEAERFAGLPPIESHEFEDIDWDKLYARFADEC